MPSRWAVSEPWMERMMDALGDNLALVAAGHCGGLLETRGGIPLVELNRAPFGRHSLARTGLASVAFRLGALEQAINEHRVTHVVCNFATLAVELSSVWSRVGAHLFVHVHGYDVSFDLLRYGSGVPAHPTGYAQRVRALGGHFIVNGAQTKSRLLGLGIPENRLHVKHLGVSPAPAPRVHTRRQGVTVLSVGRFVDAKAPDKTIRAFERSVSLGLQGTLTMVGDGPMFRLCRDLVAASPISDRIRLLGEQPNSVVLSLMADADIYTQHNEVGRWTRQVEAWGVTLVEAMAAGVPVVGTNSGGADEIVDGGRTGLKVPPGDIEAHAKALVLLAGDPATRNRLGNASWHRAKNCYSPQLEADRFQQILASVRGEPRNPAFFLG